jgi:hypothetical protein
MNAKAHVAQRRHARFRPLAYAACSTPRGSIGSPPERGGGAYVITRSGIDTCQHRTPAWVQNKARVCSVLEPPDPIRGGGGPDPIQGSGWHTWRSWTNLGGPDCISRGPTLSHGGSELTVEALGSITFSGHVAVLDPLMWWGQALLWT